MALGDIKVIRKVGGQDIRPPSGETWLILGITGDDSGAPSSGQVSFEDEVVAWISEESNFVDRAVSLFDKIGVNDTGFSNDYIFIDNDTYLEGKLSSGSLKRTEFISYVEVDPDKYKVKAYHVASGSSSQNVDDVMLPDDGFVHIINGMWMVDASTQGFDIANFSVSLVGDTESFGFQTRGELFAPGSPRKFIIPYDSNANARIHSGNGDADLVICYSVIPDNLPF